MLYFICIICFLLALIFGVCMLLLKRQIKDICRQMQFKNKNNSNLLITRNFGMKEIDELVDALNKMVGKYQSEKTEMEEKDIRLKETITNISHDIRTPLTSLSGYFELLKETESKEEQEHYLEVMGERITCLKEMLEQLFTYVKLQNGEYELEAESFDGYKVLCGTLVEFYEVFQKKNIEPKIRMEETEINLCLNKLAFQRIFENIIKNALEHGEQYFELELQEDFEKVSIMVKNDIKPGAKIDTNKIFERFYKADKSRSQTSTGLGLAIAHDFVCKMGGDIRASVYGNYFEIKVTFRLASPYSTPD